MSFDAVKAILVELGVEEEVLGPDCHLRADLALDSTETTELELELKRRFNTMIDLWDNKDYTIQEIAERIAGGNGQATGSRSSDACAGPLTRSGEQRQ